MPVDRALRREAIRYCFDNLPERMRTCGMVRGAAFAMLPAVEAYERETLALETPGYIEAKRQHVKKQAALKKDLDKKIAAIKRMIAVCEVRSDQSAAHNPDVDPLFLQSARAEVIKLARDRDRLVQPKRGPEADNPKRAFVYQMGRGLGGKARLGQVSISGRTDAKPDYKGPFHAFCEGWFKKALPDAELPDRTAYDEARKAIERQAKK